jgi:DNA polymerase bacteriophage-type
VSTLIAGLEQLAEDGITLAADGADLLWEAENDLTDAQRAWMKAHKPALLRELSVVRLDFETISPADIKLGVPAYLRDPETKVLMLAWSVGLGEPRVWRPGEPAPAALVAAIEAGALVVSHGPFDRLVWNALLVPAGWPAMPVERWSDTMARCRAYRAPAKLEKAAERLELGVRKDPADQVLIRRAIEAARGGRPITPEELAAFDRYARTDLEVLRELDRMLPELSEAECAAYRLTEAMNARGWPVDRQLAARLWGLWQAEDARLTERMLELNGLRPTQNLKLKAYVEQHIGEALPSGEGKVWAQWLREHPDADAPVRDTMTTYVEALNKAGTKLQTLLACTADADPFARGALVWHGAHTGRWSGTLFQPQNMPRTTGSTLETLVGLLQPDGPVASGISLKQRIASCLRAVIRAPAGQRLVVADFSQIESRVLCWIAGQGNMLTGYRRPAADKWDPYIATANALGSNDRQFGKLLVLAAGFGGSARMLLAKAPDYGVALTEDQAERAIAGWREANQDIVDFWNALYRTVRDVVESPAGTSIPVGNAFPRSRLIASFETDDTLRIALPSGRSLIYHQPRIVQDDEVEWRFNLIYQQAGPGDWREKTAWRGLITENVVQALAYDLMADKMLRMDAAGITLVGTVHDEAIAFASAQDAEAVLARMLEIMSTPPEWASGLPLVAEGYVNERYVKP